MAFGTFKESAKSYFEKSKIRKYLFRIILLALTVLISWGTFAVFANYSNGVRAGVVQKFSKKGYVFKTWEGQLFQGTTVAGSSGNATPLSGTIWDYSVDCNNKEVVDAINNALVSGKRVTLHYKEKYYHFSWRGDTKYFIYKVDELN